ncbi:dipeptide epimerase [Lysobacter sp. Root983]|uniref:dipeptide epimerase n=1 Tax=Lysobacter sp. Root983 TaxID=1736613 RepID=UPI0007109329|nr:dipeptide epimerase [Lysobacter sp. Root983]KRD76991.1 mandelate racemase [Lysobacter sp. Root983]
MPQPSRRLQLAIEPLPLRTPLRIAGHAFAAMPALVAQLQQDGCRGRGEASGVYYFGDDPPTMQASVLAQREAIESGIDREALRALLPPGGARNAIDCALWELEAQLSGRPVWALAGIDAPQPLTTMFTLGADDPATVAAGARAYAQARVLKLKLDGDADADCARVRAARAARPDATLAVDANQGYRLDSIAPLIAVLHEQGVRLLEQPFARGSDADLDALDSGLELIADESVQGLDDIEALVGRYRVVNIKLDKCGGLTEALLMVERARALGLKTMVGNMLGSSWAAAPAFVLAQRCDYVDLDGPSFIAQDRAEAVFYRDGRIHCPASVWGDGVASRLSPISTESIA